MNKLTLLWIIILAVVGSSHCQEYVQIVGYQQIPMALKLYVDQFSHSGAPRAIFTPSSPSTLPSQFSPGILVPNDPMGGLRSRLSASLTNAASSGGLPGILGRFSQQSARRTKEAEGTPASALHSGYRLLDAISNASNVVSKPAINSRFHISDPQRTGLLNFQLSANTFGIPVGGEAPLPSFMSVGQTDTNMDAVAKAILGAMSQTPHGGLGFTRARRAVAASSSANNSSNAMNQILERLKSQLRDALIRKLSSQKQRIAQGTTPSVKRGILLHNAAIASRPPTTTPAPTTETFKVLSPPGLVQSNNMLLQSMMPQGDRVAVCVQGRTIPAEATNISPHGEIQRYDCVIPLHSNREKLSGYFTVRHGDSIACNVDHDRVLITENVVQPLCFPN